MRLVTWNCCGSFLRKSERVSELKPDILAVQEVEDLGESPAFAGKLQPTYFHRISLRQLPRSIGLFSYTGVELDWVRVAGGVRCYKAKVDGLEFQIMDVWTTKAAGGDREDDYRQLHEALVHQDGWVRHHPTVVLGDFNQNASQPGDDWSMLEKLLSDLGLVSAYHHFSNEAFGHESRPTFYRDRKPEEGQHLDYCFLPQGWCPHITGVTVGTHEEWGDLSDHVPLIVDLDFEAS